MLHPFDVLVSYRFVVINIRMIMITRHILIFLIILLITNIRTKQNTLIIDASFNPGFSPANFATFHHKMPLSLYYTRLTYMRLYCFSTSFLLRVIGDWQRMTSSYSTGFPPSICCNPGSVALSVTRC